MLTASNSLRPPKLPSLPSPTCPKRTRNRTQAQRSCHSKAHSPHPTKSPSGFETDRFESAEEIQISLWIFYGKRQARRLHRSCTATTKTESAILELLLVSQDNHEIFLTIAYYHDRYLTYLKSENISNEPLKSCGSFLKMQACLGTAGGTWLLQLIWTTWPQLYSTLLLK